MCLVLANNKNPELYFRLHLLSSCNWILLQVKACGGRGAEGYPTQAVSLPYSVWWSQFLTPCQKASRNRITWLASIWCWFVLLVQMVKTNSFFWAAPHPRLPFLCIICDRSLTRPPAVPAHRWYTSRLIQPSSLHLCIGSSWMCYGLKCVPPPKNKICWSSNLQYLSMCPYLKVGCLQM